ncbi:GTP pyrophosphokinase family protein [Methylobacterium sp. A49B]
MTVRDDYRRRHDGLLTRLADGIEAHIREHLQSVPRIDRIGARAKSVDRFVAKSEKIEDGKAKYSDPLSQIQDQVGARIITFYLSDVIAVSSIIERYFRPVESRLLIPESEWEFGYFGKHYILLMPTDVIEANMDRADVPDFFELQIKTLFQHAWSEANHDLGYKPGAVPLSADEKRRMAFTAAQSWGADRLFDELFKERTSGGAG